MKGKIIDFNDSEVFVLLQDDTIVRLPATISNISLCLGSTIYIPNTFENFNCNNNHKNLLNKHSITNYN